MSSVKDEKQRKVVIVGAGLVGSLQALYFGQRSYNVEVTSTDRTRELRLIFPAKASILPYQSVVKRL